MKIVTGGDASAGTIDAEDHRLDVLVGSGLFNLLVRVAEQPFQDDAVEGDDGHLVAGAALASVVLLRQLAGFPLGHHGDAEAEHQDKHGADEIEREGKDEGAAEERGSACRWSGSTRLRDIAHEEAPLFQYPTANGLRSD
jgi:hypothetical protein